MSMLWVYMLANLIVDIIELFDIMSGLSSVLLGLTLLSWGNSVGDVFTSVAISKKGMGEMAITGCLAGPIFNLMLGIGLTTWKCNTMLPQGIVFNNLDVEWNTQFKLTIFTIGVSLFTLFELVWLVVTNNYKVARWHGHVLLWTYIISTIIMVCLCF